MARKGQADIEDVTGDPVDRAARAVRAFQRGDATLEFTRSALQAVPELQIDAVSIATRVPGRQLKGLRDS